METSESSMLMNMDQYNHYYYLKRFFLLWSFVCLIIELESSFLFLWPLNHSCEQLSNLKNSSNISKESVDSGGQPIDPEAIQINLADANSEDPITTARGLSMGYNYDDIGRCLEHPIEYDDRKTGDLTIDMNNLEPCRNGLRYELIIEHNLSVIAQFQLACTRQWLKLLLYQSICIGAIIGLIISHCIGFKQPLKSVMIWLKEEYSEKVRKERHYFEREESSKMLMLWCLIQLVLILLAEMSGYSLESYKYIRSSSFNKPNTYYDAYNTGSHRPSDYMLLLLSVLSRSIMIFSNISRIIINWTFKSSFNAIKYLARSQQLLENHRNTVSLVAIYIVFEALYLPVVVRIFHHWYDLNQFLTSLTSINIVIATIYEILFLRSEFYNKFLDLYENSSSRWCYYFKESNLILSDNLNNSIEDKVHITNSDSIKALRGAIECGKNMNTNTSSKRWRHIEYHGFTTSNNEYPSPPPFPYPMKVCEFCLIAPEQTAYSANEEIATSTINNLSTAKTPTPALQPMNHHNSHDNNNNSNHHHHHHSREDGQKRQNNGNNDTIMMKLNDSSVVDFDPYRPTTVSNDSLINNENYNYIFNDDNDDDEYDEVKESNSTTMPTNDIPSLSLVTKQTMSQSSCSSEYITSSSSPYPEHFEASPSHRPSSSSASRLNERRFIENPSRARHDLGRMCADLFRSPIIIQLNLLTFCLSFNYFLLKMTPNHVMIHSESIASKYARKLSHHKTLLTSVSPFSSSNAHYSIDDSKVDWLHNDKVIAENNHNSYEITGHVNHWLNQNISLNSSDNKMKTNITVNSSQLIDNIQEMNESVPLEAHLFDYGDLNRAIVIFNSLYNSYNPFEIIGTTIELNQWPITLFIFLLYTSKSSSFESTYFNPKRLFALVQIGSQLLVIEWILIAISRRQYHLLEVESLRIISIWFAKICATLMAYNYLHNLLKLSRKMRSTQLFRFGPNIICLIVALSIASLAPAMEKLDLAIIPIGLLINNSLSYFISKSLGNKFEHSLCPLMFE